jgi:Cu(I)/Ag(I) efflux system membrane fusion protein
MKSATPYLLVLTAALGVAGGWLATRHLGTAGHPDNHAHAADAPAARDVIYTCSMHPQVRQNKPGTCPFCGMALAPLSAAGGASLPPGSVMLSSNRVNAIHVQTSPARRLPLQRTLRVAGIIDDNDSRHRFLSAYVDGRIDRLFVNYVGAEVRAGQPLATFFSPMLLAAEREYVSLVRRAATVSAGAAREEQERLVTGARQRLRQLGLSEAQITALPAKPADAIHTELLAPTDGTVVSRMAYEGLYVKEGERLFEIADFSSMWFRFDAYERDLAWLRPGQKVTVTTPSLPGRTFESAIAFIDPNLNDPTRSAKVRVELPNPLVTFRDPAGTNQAPRRELLHKLYAEAVVHVTLPTVLTIPRTAVLAPGRTYVFVDQGSGIYEQRQVKLGRAGDELWEVLDGVKEGEMVVTTGNLLIDAQAQLDSGGASAEPAAPATSDATATAPGDWPPLSDGQREVARAYLATADSLTSALSSDQLPEFNRLAPGLAAASERLAAALTNGSWNGLATNIVAASRIGSAPDLKAARQAFHPLSLAGAALGLALRTHAGLDSVHVFECPMVKQAFPGAPRSGRWIQLKPGTRNPYFGADMLDCGTEVAR